MRKPMLTVAVVATLAVAALAADIPTRYSGSFPSDGKRTNITGTFTGKALTLRYTRVVDNRLVRRTFTGGCSASGSVQTKCTGRFQGSGNEKIDSPTGSVTLTWSDGKPVATSFGM